MVLSPLHLVFCFNFPLPQPGHAAEGSDRGWRRENELYHFKKGVEEQHVLLMLPYTLKNAMHVEDQYILLPLLSTCRDLFF